MRLFKRILTYSLIPSLILSPMQAYAGPKELWTQVAQVVRSGCETKLMALAEGRLAHRQSTDEFQLDNYTWKDLNLSELVYPLLSMHSPSDLGNLRLFNMLAYTSVDSNEIRMRQEAIRELMADPSLIHDIKAMFETLSKLTKESKMIKHITGQEAVNSPIPFEMISGSLIHGAWMLPAYVAQFGNSQAMGMAGIFGVILLFAGSMASMPLLDRRARHVEVKNLIKQAQQLSERIKAVKSPLLQEVLASLKPFDRNNQESPQNRFARQYLRVQDGFMFSKFLNFSHFTSFSMRLMDKRLDENRNALVRLGTAMSELAALTALAEFSSQPGMTFPKVLDENLPTQLKIVKGHHPHVRITSGDESIANDVFMSADPSANQKFMLLTGINTGGKSTLLRMLGTNILLGQAGAAIPVEYAEWTPMGVLTNMNVNDSVAERASFFRAQVNRVKSIFEKMKGTKHALILMDEIFTGTSPEEHHGAERAVIEYLMSTNHVSVLATHDRSLAELEKIYPNFRNFHVGDIGEPKYVLAEGVSKTRNAVEVMREAGMPEDFLQLVEKNAGSKK